MSLVVRVTRRVGGKTYVGLASRKPAWYDEDASDLARPFARPTAFAPNAPECMPHYFTQFPKRLGATPVPSSKAQAGYYYQNYIKPGVVEQGTDHRRYGGFTRDYPLQIGLSAATTGYELRDMRLEIQEAKAIGMSGFTLNMLSIRGYDGAPDTVGHWTRMKRMYDAADAEGDFKIIPMPDCKSGSTVWVKQSDGVSPDINASADALANACNQLVKRTCQYRIGGKAVIAPYYPEGWPGGTPASFTSVHRQQFFVRFKQTMLNTYGEDVLLWFCYVEQWTDAQCAPRFNSIAYGHGRWGDRDATSVTSGTTNNGGAASYCRNNFNKPWMHFGGTPGDTRPNAAGLSGPNYRTWERWGTRTLEGSWKVAISSKADFNQIPTWNDFTEHAHICPSYNNSYALADLTAYFNYRYRTGYWPTIVRDCVYLTHRLHLANPTMDPATLQVAFSTLAGATPYKNEVEALVFCKDPGATVEILSNGTVIKTQAVVENSYTRVTVAMPTTDGAIISARLRRAGSLVPGTTVVSEQGLDITPLADDYHPRSYSSLRQALGQ